MVERAADIGKGIADLLVDAFASPHVSRHRAEAPRRHHGRADLATPSALTRARRPSRSSGGARRGVPALSVSDEVRPRAEEAGHRRWRLRSRRLRPGQHRAGEGQGERGDDPARMVDVTSAEIMASAKGPRRVVAERAAARRRRRRAAAGFGGISMTSSDYQDTILGEATETAVKQVPRTRRCENPARQPWRHDISAPSGLPGVGGDLHHSGHHHISAIRMGPAALPPALGAASDGPLRRSCWLPSSTPRARAAPRT